VLIQPVGGKRGLRAYIEGYMATYADAAPTFIGFRDRDFDVVPPSRPQLIRLEGEKPIYLTHGAAVENYLVDADLILRYWTEREGTPRWGHGPAPSLSRIEDCIEQSARELADYQAVRWALASLKPGPRWPEIETTWTEGSGFMPSSLKYADCIAEACQLVDGYRDQAADVHPDRMTESALTYRDRFSAAEFFADREYLVWFHGKDHLVCACSLLKPGFPRRHYAAWAAENVDVGKHTDLQQLVSLILAGGSEESTEVQ
jgi:hypothetical protein